MWNFEVEAPPNGWEIVLRKSRFSMGLIYGPVFRRLWTMSADVWEIIVWNEVFRLSISGSVPEIFAIELRSRPKSRRKKACFRPQILDVFFSIAPISDHVVKFRGDWPRDRGDLVANKKEINSGKHKGRVCVITQRAALISRFENHTIYQHRQCTLRTGKAIEQSLISH